MKIPKYVQELMERSSYEYFRCTDDPNYGAGYTIRVQKRTEYAKVDSLEKEVERLVKWANRVAGDEIAYVLDVPTKTHYHKQSAVVTIFDPVMQKIEQYIPYKEA